MKRSLSFLLVLFPLFNFSQTTYKINYTPYLSEKSLVEPNQDIQIKGNDFNVYQYYIDVNNDYPLNLHHKNSGEQTLIINEHSFVMDIYISINLLSITSFKNLTSLIEKFKNHILKNILKRFLTGKEPF